MAMDSTNIINKDEEYLQSAIPKRISLFESFLHQQTLDRLALPPSPIQITLPDLGQSKSGTSWNTTPLEIAEQISEIFASDALIAKVNGDLWDLRRPLEADCELQFLGFDSDEGRNAFWRSSAHLLAAALEQTYGCRLRSGSSLAAVGGRDFRGFYYDAALFDFELSFEVIESAVAKLVNQRESFLRIEVTKEQAVEIFGDDEFKVKIINSMPEEERITVYRFGSLVDLCSGPNIPNSSLVRAFRCLKTMSFSEGLQRVYGISFPDPEQLDEYNRNELGKKHELFFFHHLSPGSCFFLPHGARICIKLIEFMTNQYRNRGYREVWSPNTYSMELWEKYGLSKKNLIQFEIKSEVLNSDKKKKKKSEQRIHKFGVKTSNCPGHCLIFDYRVRSHAELPLRLADFGVLLQNEPIDALSGFNRLRRVQQDDGHIFCREFQIKDEVKNVLEFVNYVYGVFGLSFELKLCTRPDVFYGDVKAWEKAEAAFTEALNEFGKPWKVNEGCGAFHGPKIDVIVSCNDVPIQCGNVEVDFEMPARFDLGFWAGEEGSGDWERPVMIHRGVIGSVERMFRILLEKYKGKWPFWLSPSQVMVCSVSEEFEEYALRVRDRVHDAGFYVDVDTSERRIDEKVGEARLAEYNYVLVVGEGNGEVVDVRVRDDEDGDGNCFMSVEDLLNRFRDEAAAFR